MYKERHDILSRRKKVRLYELLAHSGDLRRGIASFIAGTILKLPFILCPRCRLLYLIRTTMPRLYFIIS